MRSGIRPGFKPPFLGHILLKKQAMIFRFKIMPAEGVRTRDNYLALGTGDWEFYLLSCHQSN